MVRPFSRMRAAVLSRACARPSSLIESLEPRVLLSSAPVMAWQLHSKASSWFLSASSETGKPKPAGTTTTTSSTTTTTPSTTPTSLALSAVTTPTIKFGNLSFPWDGNYHPGNAVAYMTNGTTPVAGSFSYTYNGAPTPPTAPGDYAVVATFTSADANYSSASSATILSVGTSSIVPANGAVTHVTQSGGVFTYFVDSGSVSFGGDLSAMAPFNLNVAAGASATVSSRQTLNTLTLGSNATLTVTNTGAPKPQVVKSLTLGSSAKLDLNANDLIVDYTGQSNPSSTLRTLLAAGYSNGTWSGTGLTSSSAKANAGTYSLNLFDNAAAAPPFTTFDGVPVGLQTALVKYTYIADILIDGKIDSNDAITLANNYADGAAATHQRGDLNYNGIFDSNDAILFANAYSEGASAMPIAVPNAPGGLALLTTSSSTINLSWQDNSASESSYLVQRSADGAGFTTVATLGANTTSWQDTGLTSDTKYYYRVLAANASGNSPATAIASDTTLPVFTGKQLFVDKNYTGTTKNGGFATPYTTIASALAAITSSDTAGNGIIVRQGTYNETVAMKTGTTLMSFPNELATVSGFATLTSLQPTGVTTGWTQASANIWQITLKSSPTTLFVNYTPQDLARSPNSGWWKSVTVTHDTVANTTTLTDATHLAGIPSLVGGYFYAHIASGNVYGGGTITAHDTTAGTITMTGLQTLAANDYYIVKNTPTLLDRPGEWTVAPSGSNYVVSYWPLNVADLPAVQTRNSTTQQIAMNNIHDAVVRGLEVTGNTGYGIYATGNAYNVTARDNIVHHNASTGVFFRYTNNVTARNNYIVANGTGLGVSSVNVGLLEGNEVASNTIDGIIVAGDIHGQPPTDPTFVPTYDVVVKNNYSHHNLGYSHSDGIQMYRTVYDTTYISNLVMNNGQGLMTEEITNTELAGNVFWNTAAYTVIGKTNTVTMNIHNNTIGGAGYGPYNLSSSPGVTANENITIGTTGNGSTAAGYYTGDRNFFYQPVTGGNIVSANSKWYTTLPPYQADTGKDLNSKTGNPLFINAPTVSTMAIGNKTLNTTTKLYVNSISGFSVGDHIEINGDGVVRTVTATTSGTNNNTISFDLPLPSPPMTEYTTINNWKTKTDYALDLRLQAGSLAGNMSATAGAVGATLSIPAYVALDFNGDGRRDIPLPSMAVIAGIPNSVNWSPPTY